MKANSISTACRTTISSQQMHDDLYDGLKDEITDGVNILLKRGWSPYDA